MDFTIYRWDRKTNIGKILRAGRCPDKVVARQAGEGESVLAGVALCDLHCYIKLECTMMAGEWVVTGPGKEICTYTPEEITTMHGAEFAADLVATETKARLKGQGVNPELAKRFALRQKYNPIKRTGQMGFGI